MILSPYKERTLFRHECESIHDYSERIIQAKNGWVVLLLLFGLLIGDIAC